MRLPAWLVVLAVVGTADATPTPADTKPPSHVINMQISSAYACGLIDGKGVYTPKRPRACDSYRETARQNGITVPVVPHDPTPPLK